MKIHIYLNREGLTLFAVPAMAANSREYILNTEKLFPAIYIPACISKAPIDIPFSLK